MSSSIFFYEPFYHFDRLLDEALPTRRRIDVLGEGVVKYFKPK